MCLILDSFSPKKRGGLTNVFWSSHDLPELLVAADHPGQTKVHDLDVAQRRTAGQQDVLRLSGEETSASISPDSSRKNFAKLLILSMFIPTL